MSALRPKSLTRWLALAALAVVFPSCDGGITGIDRTTALRAAQDQFAGANVRSYRYTVRSLCFCGAERQGPAVVEVRNGQTVSVTAAPGVARIDRAAFEKLDTVEELFGTVRDGIESKPALLSIEYDPELAFPVLLQVDPRRNTADDEYGFSVSGFTRL